MPEKRGKLIVIEGVDGCGKTTQSGILCDYLREKGFCVHHTTEPTQSGLGGMVRDALSGEYKRTSEELAAMFMADRVSHNVSKTNGIKMHLERGDIVVCDRYYYSSLAYQGIDGAMQWVADMNLKSPVIEKPDLCIFIDMDPEKCFEHISAGRAHLEIFEKNSAKIADTRRRYMAVFDYLGGRDNVVIIDGGRTIEEVSKDIKNAVEKVI